MIHAGQKVGKKNWLVNIKGIRNVAIELVNVWVNGITGITMIDPVNWLVNGSKIPPFVRGFFQPVPNQFTDPMAPGFLDPDPRGLEDALGIKFHLLGISGQGHAHRAHLRWKLGELSLSSGVPKGGPKQS